MSFHYSDNPTYLELLPPELQCQILKMIPDMESLHALLRASPRYFQVYRTSRETIFSYVAWNHISPAIVPIALDALKRRKRLWRRINRPEPPTQWIIRKEPTEVSSKTWKRLLRFHAIVENFISKFSSSRLVSLENSFHLQNKSSLPHESSAKRLSLSQLEYARLARAFYNLNRYGNPSYEDDGDDWPNFLNKLRDWELEELLCVRSFLIEGLIGYLNEFDNDFMEAFSKDMPRITWPPKKLAIWNSEIGFLCSLGYDALQRPWVERCLTRRFPTLSAMFSTNTLQGKFRVFQQLPIRRLGGITRSQNISEALGDIRSPSEQELAAMMKSPGIGFCDNLEQPNEAWFWAMKARGNPRSNTGITALAGRDNHDLECWGYVIWDNERLKRLGILSKK